MRVGDLDAGRDVYVNPRSSVAHLTGRCMYAGEGAESKPARVLWDDTEICSACGDGFGLSHSMTLSGASEG